MNWICFVLSTGEWAIVAGAHGEYDCQVHAHSREFPVDHLIAAISASGWSDADMTRALGPGQQYYQQGDLEGVRERTAVHAAQYLESRS